MKKYIIIIASVALILFGIISIPNVKSAALYYLPQGVSGDTSATSTTAYLTGGTGTTTKTFSSDGVEQVTFLVSLFSSTTPPTLCWKSEGSNDGTRWYGVDSTYASSTVHIQDSSEHCWTYASTTGILPQVTIGADGKEIGIRRKIIVDNLDTLNSRTIFYVRPGVAARLGVETSLKNEVITTK